MHQYLSTLRCSHEHVHTHVAGSFSDAAGKSMNLTAYTELYTQMFGQRLAGTFFASKNVRETSCVHVQNVFAEEVEESMHEPEAKRRRLASKVSNPPGYPKSSTDDSRQPFLHASVPGSETGDHRPAEKDRFLKLLQMALKQAPRVGAVVLQSGELFD